MGACAGAIESEDPIEVRRCREAMSLKAVYRRMASGHCVQPRPIPIPRWRDAACCPLNDCWLPDHRGNRACDRGRRPSWRRRSRASARGAPAFASRAGQCSAAVAANSCRGRAVWHGLDAGCRLPLCSCRDRIEVRRGERKRARLRESNPKPPRVTRS